jgi:ribonuclease HI
MKSYSRNIKIYTDASWQPATQMASCGFIIFINGVCTRKHVVIMKNIFHSHMAERFAILFAFEEIYMDLKPGDKVTLYTDQMRLIKYIRAAKGEGVLYTRIQNFINIMKFSDIRLKAVYVKSHQKADLSNIHNTIHDEIDKACSEELKKFVPEDLVA